MNIKEIVLDNLSKNKNITDKVTAKKRLLYEFSCFKKYGLVGRSKNMERTYRIL